MKSRPHEDQSVMTPDGLGIVVGVVDLSSGNGVKVFLTENSTTPDWRAASIYHLDEIDEGPALIPFEIGAPVIVPGGYLGQVVGRDGDIAVCRYEAARPRTSRHGRFHDWQLYVATLRGRVER